MTDRSPPARDRRRSRGRTRARRRPRPHRAPRRTRAPEPARTSREGRHLRRRTSRRRCGTHDQLVVAELGPHLLDGGDDALIVSRQEPHDGELERCCVDRRVVESAHEGARSASTPWMSTAAWISSRSRSHSATGASSPSSSARRSPRSSATQHMTFECTKCRGRSRDSQMPVCSAPVRGGEADEGAHRRPQIPRSSPSSANAKAASTT